MAHAVILENMCRGWNKSPEHSAQGSNCAALSAALWTSNLDTTIDVNADPLEGHHIVCLQFLAFGADFWHDEKLSYSGAYTAGDISILPAGRRPRALMHGRFACLHLYVPDQLLKATLHAYDERLSPESVAIVDPRRIHDPVIERIGRDIVTEMRNDLPMARLRVDALGIGLAIQLLRRYSSLGHSRHLTNHVSKGGLAPWQLRRCLEMLRADLSQNHGLEALASEVGLSPYHFARSFKQSVGLAPYAYLTKLRMEKAKSLVVETRLPITDIAFEVGYDSSQAMARAFKKHFQCNPSEYRRDRWS